MDSFGKTIGRQLLIMLVYFIVCKAANGTGYGHNQFMGYYVFAVVIQVISCLVLSIVSYGQKNTSKGNNYLISTVILLLVGVGGCIAMMV
jgi:hypothetical protein